MAGALLLVSGCWSLLLLAGPLGPVAGPAALPLAFLAAALLALATRPRTRRRASPELLVTGAVLGFACLPGLVGPIRELGLALGLAPRAAAASRSPAAAVLLVGLAPVFEELVYRERLLPALAARAGPLPALALSSAAFALPHGEAWNVLGTFVAGLALGAAFLATRAVELCIGLHAGMNAAVLALGRAG